MSFTAIDLFCGAGGLSEGFQQAGFDIRVGNDLNKYSKETYLKTHPETNFLFGPIESFFSEDFLKGANLNKGELDCLIGGPPCQAFSVYNHQRGLHDYRSSLFREYLRLVKGLKPKWIVMENVTGILSVGKGQAVQEIIKGLKELGYLVEYKILKAEEFGVPQERRRVVFLGNRIGAEICWPKTSHGSNQKPFITIADAISDLPKLRNGENCGDVKYATPPTCKYQIELRGNSTNVYNHSAPKLGEINLKRMKHIPQGGSWRDIPIDLLPNGMKKARRCDHTKRYGRLKWDGLSSTILTKCDVHWGAYIHPEQDRALTVREAARLQSFPDTFHFCGPKTEQYIQVGNAVPPILGKAIAKVVFDGLKTNQFDQIKISRESELEITV